MIRIWIFACKRFLTITYRVLNGYSPVSKARLILWLRKHAHNTKGLLSFEGSSVHRFLAENQYTGDQWARALMVSMHLCSIWHSLHAKHARSREPSLIGTLVTFHLDICFWQTYSTHAPFIDRMPFSRQEESIFSMLFTPNLLYLLCISYFPLLYWKNMMRMRLMW